MNILVINCGSSTIKFQLIDVENNDQVIAKGRCDMVGYKESNIIYNNVRDGFKINKEIDMPTHKEGMQVLLDTLTDKEHGVISSLDEIYAIGHRIVHGGEKFKSSVLITDDVLKDIEELSSLAPLHNPGAVMGIKAIMEVAPEKKNVGVFDTAFHQTIPDYNYLYAIDYKYFIEPNIPPVKLSDEFYEELKGEIPELKLERYEKYIEKYQLSEYDAGVLSAKRDISDYFEEVLSYGSDVELTVNFVTSAILSTIKKLEIEIKDLFITPKMLSGVIDKVKNKEISLDHGKKILYQAMEKSEDPNEIIKKQHLHQINDKEELIKVIREVMDENVSQVRQYIDEGNTYVYNFFVGKVMQKTNRQANPNMSLDIIKEELERRKNDEGK